MAAVSVMLMVVLQYVHNTSVTSEQAFFLPLYNGEANEVVDQYFDRKREPRDVTFRPRETTMTSNQRHDMNDNVPPSTIYEPN